ncbi:MAG: dihydroneopterin aldolase [Clostridia bacterium]|jgi:dihydroneopterin aldolase|nr:dihydroneopterin aldolase [Clostridia bacterium]
MEEKSDKILLYGLKFQGFHGVFPEERARGQRFEVDVEIWGDFSRAARSDDLKDALDYAGVYEKIKEIITGPPVCLLEHLAELLCREILGFDLAQKVLVRIKKPEVDLGGELSFAAIERVRCKNE